MNILLFAALVLLLFIIPVNATTLTGQIQTDGDHNQRASGAPSLGIPSKAKPRRLYPYQSQPWQYGQPMQTQMPKWVNGEPPIAPPRQLRISRVALNGQAQGTASNYVPLQAKTALRVQVPTIINHGEAPVGVVGMENTIPVLSRKIEIKTVFPGSDLNRYGIRPGDIIVAVNGVHPNTLQQLRDLTRGQPGTTFNLTLQHNGLTETIPIIRKDSRMFLQYDRYDGYFKWAAAQTRYW